MAEYVPIRNWINCFNGYTQGSRWRTGVGRIHREILSTCSGPDTFVNLCSWRDDVSQLADTIHEWSDDERRVVCIGYSYGGYTAVLLCRELEKRGIEVAHLLLIDAVWRYWSKIASPGSLFENHKIVVPGNVKKVTSWRQRKGKPYGHPVVVNESKTATDFRTLNVAHAYADDQLSVRMTALDAACPSKKEINHDS